MPANESAPSPHQYAEQVLADTQATLKAAVGIVSPENADADPRTVFPNPNVPVRAEGDEPMQLTDEQKEQLMARADELGFGREESMTIGEQGLGGSMVVIEGGQPHKMMAEALLVANDTDAKPRAIILTASAQRKIEGEAEIASAVNLFGGGQTGNTEYDMALQVLRKLPDFRDPEEHEIQGVMSLSYDIQNGYAVSQESSGQLVRVGYLGSGSLATAVHMLRIDREDYVEDGKPRYRKQPNTADIIGIIDAEQKLAWNTERPIAFVTSGVYRPSRAVLVALAGLETGRHVGLATYGNALVNEVRGTDLPPPVKQLPGELQYMAEMSVKLEEALGAEDADGAGD